jgi:hypothetical protein
MCPYLKGMICQMVGISPAHLECVRTENCHSGNSLTCDVYISQFFFDSNDEYIGVL